MSWCPIESIIGLIPGTQVRRLHVSVVLFVSSITCRCTSLLVVHLYWKLQCRLQVCAALCATQAHVLKWISGRSNISTWSQRIRVCQHYQVFFFTWARRQTSLHTLQRLAPNWASWLINELFSLCKCQCLLVKCGKKADKRWEVAVLLFIY